MKADLKSAIDDHRQQNHPRNRTVRVNGINSVSDRKSHLLANRTLKRKSIAQEITRVIGSLKGCDHLPFTLRVYLQFDLRLGAVSAYVTHLVGQGTFFFTYAGTELQVELQVKRQVDTPLKSYF
jgi:hypothetical protein